MDEYAGLPAAACPPHCDELRGPAESPSVPPPEASTAPARRLYSLCLVDVGTGTVLSPASEADAEALGELLSREVPDGLPDSPAFSVEPSSNDKSCSDASGGGGTGHSTGSSHKTAYYKPGGPCDHCGVAESPQWRRGPASKPVLCNACGTRHRRCGQLGPALPPGARLAARLEAKTPLKSGSKKRSAAAAAGAGAAALDAAAAALRAKAQRPTCSGPPPASPLAGGASANSRWPALCVGDV